VRYVPDASGSVVVVVRDRPVDGALAAVAANDPMTQTVHPHDLHQIVAVAGDDGPLAAELAAL
jgi:hypothetical protein